MTAIEAEAAEFQRIRRQLPRSPQNGAQSGQQFFHANGFAR
jgi:hypothetical protein